MRNNQRFLFLAEGQLGDLLLLTPALRALKKKYPSSFITLLLFQRRKYNNSVISAHKVIAKSSFNGTTEVFKNNPYSDEVLEIDREYLKSLKGIAKIKAELNCIRYLRKYKFDTVICTFPESRFVIYSYFSGAKTRIGQMKQSLSFLLTYKIDIEKKRSGVLKYYCGLLEPLGVKPDSYDTEIFITDEDKISAEKILVNAGVDLSKKIILVHPGASAPNKIWPVGYFAKVIDYISEKNIAQVIVCNNSFDLKTVEAIKGHVNCSIFEISIDTVPGLAAIMQRCRLCLVNNSGPRHLAAALGIKNIAMFTKEDTTEWGIYDDGQNVILQSEGACKHCPENVCKYEIKDNELFGSYCMWDISPEKVIFEIEKQLSL